MGLPKSTADVLKARNDFSGLLDDLDTLVIIVNNADRENSQQRLEEHLFRRY